MPQLLVGCPNRTRLGHGVECDLLEKIDSGRRHRRRAVHQNCPVRFLRIWRALYPCSQFGMTAFRAGAPRCTPRPQGGCCTTLKPPASRHPLLRGAQGQCPVKVDTRALCEIEAHCTRSVRLEEPSKLVRAPACQRPHQPDFEAVRTDGLVVAQRRHGPSPALCGAATHLRR